MPLTNPPSLSPLPSHPTLPSLDLTVRHRNYCVAYTINRLAHPLVLHAGLAKHRARLDSTLRLAAVYLQTAGVHTHCHARWSHLEFMTTNGK